MDLRVASYSIGNMPATAAEVHVMSSPGCEQAAGSFFGGGRRLVLLRECRTAMSFAPAMATTYSVQCTVRMLQLTAMMCSSIGTASVIAWLASRGGRGTMVELAFSCSIEHPIRGDYDPSHR